ncbi:helix-turn-helix domain-containing protein [Rhodococcus hoagii]|nr:helix-turn-helix domain-containing protein [Prescottella equi]NKS33157.1 helix-turn-helix domain-containing protein [Prescottella equi]
MNRFKKLDPQTMTERKRHLGELIQQRRAELNLTQEEVAQLGGIHSETLRQYEIGRGGDTPQERTLESIDTAMGWCLGSAKSVLIHGEEPVVDKAASPEPTSLTSPVRTTTPHTLMYAQLPTEPQETTPANVGQVKVDRDQLRRLVTLTTGLLANAARAEDPKDLLGDLTALNQLAYEMTLAAV